MKEVEKKASSETMDKIISGETTVNKVYNEIKASEKTIVQKDEVVKNEQENNSVETKPKIISKKLSDNPNFEKLCLKFNTEDFTLIQKAAEKNNLSITEYATKILLNTVSKNIV
jgi:hypothetical protein